jgi:hypothetical protein
MVKKYGKKKDVFELRPLYEEIVHSKFQQLNQIEIDENDTISLYHGTSTHYLNEILQNGLLARKDTCHNNWEKLPSFEYLTYLTNKWQYAFAFNAVMELFEKENILSYPCYVEFKIPKALLVADEDLINTKYMVNRINKSIRKNGGKLVLDMTWEESLAQQGTVAYLGNIPKKYLESFTIIGDWDFIDKYVANDKSDYMLDYKQLQEGKGKGKRVKAIDMITRETESNLNLTWFMKDLENNAVISEIFYDKDLDRLRCIFATPIEGEVFNDINTSMSKEMQDLINRNHEALINYMRSRQGWSINF